MGEVSSRGVECVDDQCLGDAAREWRQRTGKGKCCTRVFVHIKDACLPPNRKARRAWLEIGSMSDRFCYGTGPSRQKRVNARIRGSAAEHGSWVWRCNAITSAACVLAAGGGEERLADEWHAKRARWASWASWARWASVEEWGYTCVVVLRETRETSSSARAYVYGVYVFVSMCRTIEMWVQKRLGCELNLPLRYWTFGSGRSYEARRPKREG